MLASSNLAGADVLILAPGTDHGTDATPLSTNEQNAMVAYVQNGGGLILLSDNYSYASNATNEEQALLSPFGMSGYGTIIGAGNANVFTPGANPVTGGSHGTVGTFSQNYAGAITNIGPFATAIASNSLGIALALIAPGALGPNSGPVAIFSDGNTFSNESAGAGVFLSNQALFLNTVSWAQRRFNLPALFIALAGPATVKVSWPNIGSFTLQQSSNLAAGSWTSNSLPITLANGTNSVTITPPAGNLFFRLTQ